MPDEIQPEVEVIPPANRAAKKAERGYPAKEPARLQTEECHRVLGECDGDLAKAAAALGVTRKALERKIAVTPELYDYLPDNPRQARLRTPVAVRQERAEFTEVDAAKAMAVEDNLFKNKIGKLGFMPEHVEKIMTLQEVARDHFATTLRVMHGGMSGSFVHLIEERDKISKLFTQAMDNLNSQPQGTKERLIALEEMRVIGKMLREIGQEIIHVNEITHKGALVMAVVKQSQNRKQGKLGFKPNGHG